MTLTLLDKEAQEHQPPASVSSFAYVCVMQLLWLSYSSTRGQTVHPAGYTCNAEETQESRRSTEGVGLTPPTHVGVERERASRSERE